MKPILVVYATREGHTMTVAQHVAATLASQHLESELMDAAHIPESFALRDYCAAIVCASVHLGEHEREIARFVRDYLPELEEMPAAFISVSLAEADAEDRSAPEEKRMLARAEAMGPIEKFLADTGWNPLQVKAVAGALMYLKYNFAVRFIMKRIAKKRGAPTDASQNYEFTDWTDLDRTVKEFAVRV